MENIKIDQKNNSDPFSYSGSPNIEDENRILRETINQLRYELDRYRRAPLMICEVREIMGKNAIIKIPNGNQFFVEISDECEVLRSGDAVYVEQKNLTIIKKARLLRRYNVERFINMQRPDVTWNDIGGLEEQVREIKEVIELPLKKPQLFKKVGITPPKGVLLHGPPGTGKTLLAKAVASSTNSTFIQIVASELVQKFIGEGAKLVKEVFHLAREKAPSIVFIDELDALAAKRIELGTSGEREVQRTFMQLLSEIDGFKNLDNVKIIGCSNRKDILDPAIIRPGRLDRLIYVPLPTKKGREEIFKIHSKDMNLKMFSSTRIVDEMDNFSGAEIKATCTEAGYFAIRDNRTHIIDSDFTSAIKKIRQSEEIEGKEHLSMFG